jgi:gamma-glutamylcysteine synthetase
MNKSVRNVASVNGPSQQEVIASLEADLELAKLIAKQNFEIAEELGGALEIAEGKISTLQARVEELEKELAVQNEGLQVSNQTLEELSKRTLASETPNLTKNINKRLLKKIKNAVNEEISVKV